MSKREQTELELRRGPEKQIYGFFDIDDTLTKGNTTIFFTKFLAEKGFVLQEIWLDIQADLTSYINSDRGEESYLVFATNVLNRLALGLKDKNVNSVKEKAEEFLKAALSDEIEGYNILGFSKNLVSKIKKMGKAVAISGSPEEILIPINEYLGFDEIEATVFEKQDDYFTGKVTRNLAIDREKMIVISHYLDKVDVNKSFAFGDSTHDIPLLNSVGNSYVLGNNRVLQNIGIENGWHIHQNGDGVLEAINENNS